MTQNVEHLQLHKTCFLPGLTELEGFRSESSKGPLGVFSRTREWRNNVRVYATIRVFFWSSFMRSLVGRGPMRSGYQHVCSQSEHM